MLYGTRGWRFGSVGPALGGGSSSSSSSRSSTSLTTGGVAHGYRPSYAAMPSKYFTTSPDVSSALAVSYRSRPSFSTRYYDPVYPSRYFGSRLGKSYTGVYARPEVYDEYYSTSHIPGLGRDSWSAYKISDSAIDRDEDLAYYSKRKDYELLKGVELALSAAAFPVPRSSSVPPQRRSSVVQQTVTAKPQTVSRRRNLSGRLGRASSVQDVRASYDPYVTPPKVKVVYETVPQGRDLLTARERLVSREMVDLESPSGTLSLKLRLAQASELLGKQGAMLSKYGGDKESAEAETEVRRIRNSQAMRACSVI